MDCRNNRSFPAGARRSGRITPPNFQPADLPFIKSRLSPAGGVVISGIDLSQPISAGKKREFSTRFTSTTLLFFASRH